MQPWERLGNVPRRAVGERRASPEHLGGGRRARPHDGIEVLRRALLGPQELLACYDTSVLTQFIRSGERTVVLFLLLTSEN